jgi:hypothetical protein
MRWFGREPKSLVTTVVLSDSWRTGFYSESQVTDLVERMDRHAQVDLDAASDGRAWISRITDRSASLEGPSLHYTFEIQGTSDEAMTRLAMRLSDILNKSWEACIARFPYG